MKTVNIPADYFFRMAIKDYYDWRSALIREFIQNSVDAGAKSIDFKFDGEKLEITDDGGGMSLSTIETALLTLGGSEKSAGSFGGLGKAKEILYFAWPEWEIRSKTTLIIGAGAQYDIKKIPNQIGTISKILVKGKLKDVERHLKDYLNVCSFEKEGVSVTYNDQPVGNSGIQYGAKIFTIEGLGDLYLSEGFNDNGKVIVQAHGLYMFSCHSVLDKCYVFNITHPSYDCLTSNRDSFVGEWQDKFSQMVAKVAIDSESTNLKKEIIIQVNALSRTDFRRDIKERAVDGGYKKLVQPSEGGEDDIADPDHPSISTLLIDGYLATEAILDKATQKELKIALKNSTTINSTKFFHECLSWYKKAFPEGFIIVADQEMTSDLVWSMYCPETLKMTWIWKSVVDEIAEAVGIDRNYGYGLLMSKDLSRFAECRNGFLLFNPTPFFEVDWHECIVEFVLSACEELTHHIGYSYHNESFKCRFVEIIKQVLIERLSTSDIYRGSKKVTRKHGVANC